MRFQTDSNHSIQIVQNWFKGIQKWFKIDWKRFQTDSKIFKSNSTRFKTNLEILLRLNFLTKNEGLEQCVRWVIILLIQVDNFAVGRAAHFQQYYRRTLLLQDGLRHHHHHPLLAFRPFWVLALHRGQSVMTRPGWLKRPLFQLCSHRDLKWLFDEMHSHKKRPNKKAAKYSKNHKKIITRFLTASNEASQF